MVLVLVSHGFCNLDKIHEALLVQHEPWFSYFGPHVTKIHEPALVSLVTLFKSMMKTGTPQFAASAKDSNRDPKLHKPGLVC